MIEETKSVPLGKRLFISLLKLLVFPIAGNISRLSVYFDRQVTLTSCDLTYLIV